jgi:pimeloyl-ACP methyl ester carboxylesterase
MSAAATRELEIAVPAGVVCGTLEVPPGARGIVLFAHGSGSGRFSVRNRHVAARLRERGLGTLLFDLLTAAEERVDAVTREHRFDIPLLAERLLAASAALGRLPSLPRALGYFGASTGAAAALIAAAAEPRRVRAVVSRGGRPDLAGPSLARVRAPTLLIVGGADEDVLELNRRALAELRCAKRLAIVPHATHLFEEPGALDVVVDHAADWFVRYLGDNGVDNAHDDATKMTNDAPKGDRP